jgi:hypothetical protein
MNTRFTTSDLIRRPAHTTLDNMPIHIGDIVYLKPANGPEIRATVIYNAPGQRIRFRHEHVHRIEPVRSATH